jgi:hypothetical protein
MIFQEEEKPKKLKFSLKMPFFSKILRTKISKGKGILYRVEAAKCDHFGTKLN